MKKTFHHAFGVDKSICVGCTHCMKVCPTQAIRIRGGKAELMANRCIDCGECYRACPVHAFKIEEDDLSAIHRFKVPVALVPAVMMAQFPDNVSTGQIYQAIHKLGFSRVFEVEQSVNFLKEKMMEYQQKNAARPLISTFCPATVRLIQVRFPALTDHFILLKPPHDLTAELVKNNLLNEGHDENEIGMFYITPCAAKIAAIKSPVGEEKSIIDGVINIDSLFNKIMYLLKNEEGISAADERTHLGADAITWSLTNGEAKHMKYTTLAIDGINNVDEFLEKLENEEINNVDFLELRACDESCAGGILCASNRFLVQGRLLRRASLSQQKTNNKSLTGKEKTEASAFLESKMTLDTIDARPVKLDEDLGTALKKMERIRELMCFLPGFDCGACGSPNCRALAEDVAQKRANISNCIFIQHTSLIDRDHAGRIIQKIWGDESLNKDCSKKGAKHEGN
ncbi:MAG: 4Fe-4S binding protein [Bacteroidales bacterium]|nr:4Fe-4S binding protein [Bacteroidales bacterium]